MQQRDRRPRRGQRMRCDMVCNLNYENQHKNKNIYEEFIINSSVHVIVTGVTDLLQRAHPHAIMHDASALSSRVSSHRNGGGTQADDATPGALAPDAVAAAPVAPRLPKLGGAVPGERGLARRLLLPIQPVAPVGAQLLGC